MDYKFDDNTEIFVISDLHGQKKIYNKIVEELDKRAADTNKTIVLIINGDLIDGGPGSIDMLLDVMHRVNGQKGKIKVVMLPGDHEEMMCSAIEHNAINQSPGTNPIWTFNNRWLRPDNHSQETLIHFKYLSDEGQNKIREFLKSLPLYCRIKSDEPGKNSYVIVHAAPPSNAMTDQSIPTLGQIVDGTYPELRACLDYKKQDPKDRISLEDEGVITIIGHTPVDNEAGYALLEGGQLLAIDAGCEKIAENASSLSGKEKASLFSLSEESSKTKIGYYGDIHSIALREAWPNMGYTFDDNTEYYVVSDLHGQGKIFDAIIADLEKRAASSGKKIVLIINGDLIDRGPDSIRMLLEVMDRVKHHKGNIEVAMLAGNHEEMMCQALFYNALNHHWDNSKELTVFNIWFAADNHGKATCNKFLELPPDQQIELLEFLLSLPLYTRIRTDKLNQNNYVIVHANPPTNAMTTRNIPTLRQLVADPDYIVLRRALIDRRENITDPYIALQEEPVVTIIGHTPVNTHDGLTSNKDGLGHVVNIDGGCAFMAENTYSDNIPENATLVRLDPVPGKTVYWTYGGRDQKDLRSSARPSAPTAKMN